MQWQPIASAPFDRDLELAVIDDDGRHALTFACRRSTDGWIGVQNQATNRRSSDALAGMERGLA
jgi:hypothetical protein